MDIDDHFDRPIHCYNCNFLRATELYRNSMVCKQCEKQLTKTQ